MSYTFMKFLFKILSIISAVNFLLDDLLTGIQLSKIIEEQCSDLTTALPIEER